ncbi:HNH endonuclease [Candidatus Poriferisodalis sp.]|uniref:HNH endonuclease n=1 Tax=Candidatus Poriferisodalis sp. TaxID=3101277 RepID=UPI003B5B5190
MTGTHRSRPESYSIGRFDNGEPYVVLPLGHIWTTHPEADEIGLVIYRERSGGRHCRAMTAVDCERALAVATRHKEGIDGQGRRVSAEVKRRAPTVVSKLRKGLQKLSASSQGGAGAQRKMFVLTWNPRPDEMSPAELDEHREYWLDKIRSTEGDAKSDGWWSTGSRSSGIDEGDDLILFLHGAGGGIIASGTATSEVYEDPADGTNWIDVEWEHWVAAEDCLPVELLRSYVAPRFFEHAPRGSGQRLSDGEAASLRQAWQDLLEQPPSLSGDEAGVQVSGGRTVPEGAISRAEVNRYERSRWARAQCLSYYGCRCQVCSLDFEERYGELGRGFMHVHHVTPLHEIAGDPNYRLDPIQHLRPVCPNCHAMLHRPKDRTLTVEELCELIDVGPDEGAGN